MNTSKRKTKIDNFTRSQLEQIVSECDSWRALFRALGYKSQGGKVNEVVARKLKEMNISVEHFTSSHATLETKYNSVDEVLIENSPAADKTIRDYYRKGNYSEYKCAICGLPPFWNGKELVLTLDHISGNHRDSRPQNLRWVCPNCDRQLPTFGGRNRKN
ncbi:MAG: HNH endonuclease [Paludibacteraceae bacterium]|nr:HNH endonuclease [Paludibacteraceae bacterium]